MKLFKAALALMLLCIALPCLAIAEQADAAALTPIPMACEEAAQTLELYCGPTQGFYRRNEQTLDTGRDFVFFGQHDCWAMVAQGTPDSFGPVGWVEAGSLSGLPYDPQLSFEDSFAAMVEEPAAVTDHPFGAAWELSLAQGSEIIVLAQLGEWLYVQTEIDTLPARVFIKANTVY